MSGPSADLQVMRKVRAEGSHCQCSTTTAAWQIRIAVRLARGPCTSDSNQSQLFLRKTRDAAPDQPWTRSAKADDSWTERCAMCRPRTWQRKFGWICKNLHCYIRSDQNQVALATAWPPCNRSALLTSSKVEGYMKLQGSSSPDARSYLASM